MTRIFAATTVALLLLTGACSDSENYDQELIIQLFKPKGANLGAVKVTATQGATTRATTVANPFADCESNKLRIVPAAEEDGSYPDVHHPSRSRQHHRRRRNHRRRPTNQPDPTDHRHPHSRRNRTRRQLHPTSSARRRRSRHGNGARCGAQARDWRALLHTRQLHPRCLHQQLQHRHRRRLSLQRRLLHQGLRVRQDLPHRRLVRAEHHTRRR
jgi:hypothetical protein